MHRVHVNSSNLSSVGYDAVAATLEVAFHNGGIYQYYDVPADIHAALLNAASKGSFHARYIKGRYRYKKVG